MIVEKVQCTGDRPLAVYPKCFNPYVTIDPRKVCYRYVPMNVKKNKVNVLHEMTQSYHKTDRTHPLAGITVSVWVQGQQKI